MAYDRVNLESLDIRNANIPGIDLASRDLQNAHFDGSNLKLAKFGRADIHSATFNAIRNAQTDLTGVDMRDAIAVSAQFNGASLTGADARGIDAPSTSFRKAYLGGSNFSQSPTIFGVWFIGPLLDRVLPPSVSEIFGSHTAYMAFADFANADAVGTKFRGANLYLAHFDQAKLNGADFSGAYLAGASFRGAVLTNAVFAGAVVDDRTDFTGADFAISFANYRAITKARFYERARYDSGFRELLRMPAPGPIPSDYPTPMP